MGVYQLRMAFLDKNFLTRKRVSEIFPTVQNLGADCSHVPPQAMTALKYTSVVSAWYWP